MQRLATIWLAGSVVLVSMHAISQDEDAASGADAPGPGTVCPLLVGERVPTAAVRTAEGAVADLAKLVGGRPTIVVFYRGGWDPYANRQLTRMRTIELQLVDLGYRVLALSPDRPEELQKTALRNEITYRLLSDSSLAAARGFGISYRVSDDAYKKQKEHGVDLEEFSGESHHALPVPAVFIVNRRGEITFSYVNPDHRERVDPDVLLAAALAALR